MLIGIDQKLDKAFAKRRLTVVIESSRATDPTVCYINGRAICYAVGEKIV